MTTTVFSPDEQKNQCSERTDRQNIDWAQIHRDTLDFVENRYDTATEALLEEPPDILTQILRRQALLSREGWTEDMVRRFSMLMQVPPSRPSRPLKLTAEQEQIVSEAAAFERASLAEQAKRSAEEAAKWAEWEAGGCVGDDPGIRDWRIFRAKHQGIIAPGYEAFAPGYQSASVNEPDEGRTDDDLSDSDGPEPEAEATASFGDEIADISTFGGSKAATGEPLDVFGSLAPEPLLEADMLPKAIGDFVFDTAPRLGNTPAVLTVATLCVCAAALNDGIKIQPKEHDHTWTERACLWLTIVGVPGTNKTAAFNAAKAPLQMVEKLWADQDREAFAKYERAMEVWEAEHAAWKKATRNGDETGLPPEEPKKPPRRQIVVNNFTMDSLAQDVLAENPHGVLLQFDELMALLGSLDAYNNGHKDRPLLLQLFDGGQMIINRRGSGRTITENWSAGILGGIQEDKLAAIAPKMTDDGLFQRFLPVRGANVAEDQDRLPDREASENYASSILALANLKPDREPVVLSPEAQEYRREVEGIARAIRDIPTFPPGLREHANKVRGIFARLLLTLHAVECAPRFRYDEFATVPGETARMARDLMVRFFIPNAIRIYTDYFGGCDEHGGDVQWIAGHILSRRYETIKARGIYRANGKFEDQKRLSRTMRTLGDCNWLRPMEPKRFNDPPSEWIVNPTVYVRFAERAEQERQHRAAVRKSIATQQNRLIRAWS